MCAILLNLQERYCPAVKSVQDGESVSSYYSVLFEGDQLMAVRARGAVRLRESHSGDEKIQGLQPLALVTVCTLGISHS